MRIPRNYRWAVARSREVFEAEGLPGVRDRAIAYARRRGSRGRQLQRLPMGSTTRHSWPASVVMVASPEPEQCYHYRVHQKVEACAALGVPFRVVPPGDPGAVADAVQLASVVIVFRQAPGPGVRAALDQAHRLGIPVVWEADDVVYRRDLVAANPNLATVPAPLRKAVITGSDGYAQALAKADHVLASTQPLADDMATRVPGRAFVVENGIDAGMFALLDGFARDPAHPARPPGAVVIGYGSGSRAHDSDLAVAADGLATVLVADPRVHLHLIGPVRVPDVLAGFGDRIWRTRQVAYPEYLRQLAACDVTIAPLVDLPFNHYKSQVKVLEAALVGVPLIASDVLYRTYVTDEATGLLAGEGQWDKALGRLVEDAELREHLVEQARAEAVDSAVTRRPARQLEAMLQILRGGS